MRCLLLLAVCCSLLTLSAAASECRRRTPCAARTAVPLPEVKLVFVGDVMLDDGPGKAIADGIDPFREFAPIFDAADLVVGNLECVVATTGTKAIKQWRFRAHPQVIPFVKRYFDVVSVANNHSCDYGPEALAEQCRLLDEAQLPYFGGGRNLAEAQRPVIVKRHGVRMALLGYYDDYPPRSFAVGETTPGVAWIDEPTITAAIKAIKREQKADLVIPFLHWGEEYETKPNREQIALAEKMIDAGADIVIGSHPHVIQPPTTYRGKPIFYSLGNFVFDNFDESICYQSRVLRLTVNRKGTVRWDMVGVQIDKQGIPHLVHEPKPPATRRCIKCR